MTRASVLKLGEVRSLLIWKLILKLKEKGLRIDLVLKMNIDPMKWISSLVEIKYTLSILQVYFICTSHEKSIFEVYLVCTFRKKYKWSTFGKCTSFIPQILKYFWTEEIDVKETWLRNIWVFQLRDLEVLPVHLSSPSSK